MSKDKKTMVTFLPGCFDSFEGTQEELDELVNQLLTFFESEEFESKMQITTDEILSDFSQEEIEDAIQHQFYKRTLH